MADKFNRLTGEFEPTEPGIVLPSVEKLSAIAVEEFNNGVRGLREVEAEQGSDAALSQLTDNPIAAVENRQ